MKKIPELRFPEFSGEWEVKRLGEMLEFKNGINASKEQYGQGIKFINVLDILNNNYITYEKIIGKVKIDEKTLTNYEVNYGDIVFQRSSETREEVGTANVYLDTKIATFGGFIIRGKKIGEYDPMFMNYLLKTSFSRNEIMSKSGGSTRYNVGQNTLSEVTIITTSMPEQTKIATFLSTLDRRIELQLEKVETLEEEKKGLMQKIFSQEIRFKDQNGKDYPEWVEKKFIDLFESVSSTPYQIKSKEYLLHGKYEVVDQGISSIVGYCNDENKVFKNIPIIVYGDHTTIIKYRNKEFVVGADGTKLLTTKMGYDLKFMYYNLKYNNIKPEGYKRHYSILKKISMMIPILQEQKIIANFLSSIDLKIEKEKERLDKLNELKKGLLQKMFV